MSTPYAKALISRRMFLLAGISSCAAFATARGHAHSLSDLDRPKNNIRSWFNRNMSCINDLVPVSSTADRVVQAEDFEKINSCTLTEDSFEGPYFTCVKPGGKNIAGGKPGQALTVAIRVTDQNCQPIPNAFVDIWGCDAEGNYSAYDADPDGLARTGRNLKSLKKERFCRGVFATDQDGIAEFDTIYPSYYVGRAIHIHYKIHIGNKAYITRQALFPESMNEKIMKLPPYNKSRNTRRVLNVHDDMELGMFHVFNKHDRLIAILPVSPDL